MGVALAVIHGGNAARGKVRALVAPVCVNKGMWGAQG